MPDITISVPTGAPVRIANALAIAHQYDERKRENETKAEFATRVTKLWWRNQVLAVEAAAAERVAGDAIRANPNDPLVTDI